MYLDGVVNPDGPSWVIAANGIAGRQNGQQRLSTGELRAPIC